MRRHGFQLNAETGKHDLRYHICSIAYQVGTAQGLHFGKGHAGATLSRHIQDFNWAATQAAACEAKIVEAFQRHGDQPLDEEAGYRRAIHVHRELRETHDTLHRFLEYCLIKLVSVSDVASVLVPIFATKVMEEGTQKRKNRVPRDSFVEQWRYFEKKKCDPEYWDLLAPLKEFAELRNTLVHRIHTRFDPFVEIHDDGEIDVEVPVVKWGQHGKHVVYQDLFNEVRTRNGQWCTFLDGAYDLFVKRKKLTPSTTAFLTYEELPAFSWAYPTG